VKVPTLFVNPTQQYSSWGMWCCFMLGYKVDSLAWTWFKATGKLGIRQKRKQPWWFCSYSGCKCHSSRFTRLVWTPLECV